MAQQFVDIDNAREEEQTQVMEQILAADHCPFCEENLRQYHKQPIIRQTDHWLLTKNQWPYDHTSHHFLIIYREHVEQLQALDPAAGQELFELIAWAEKEFNLPGGGVAMRFGDTRYSAGSVAHLHVQLLVPDIDDPDYEPVRVKIGKSPEKL